MSILDAPSTPPGSESAALLINLLSMGSENAAVTILGDSTGVIGTNPWPLRVAQWLASQFPEYTVNYRVWSDTSQAYIGLGVASIYPTNNEAQTASLLIQTGTGTSNAGGPFVLDVYNASRSGSTVSYFTSTLVRWNKIFVATPNLVFFNFGHNSNGVNTGYRATQYALTRSVQECFPLAGLIQIAQNPRATNDSEYRNSVIRQRCVIDLSGSEGYGLINIWRLFKATPGFETSLTLADGLFVHPNDAGSAAWAQHVVAHFNASRLIIPRAPGRSPTQVFIPASSFSAYLGTPTLATANNEAPMWSFPNGVDSGVAAAIDYPSHWGAYDAYLQWTYPQTSSPGNVVWMPSFATLGIGLSAINLASSGAGPSGFGDMIVAPGAVTAGAAFVAYTLSSTLIVPNTAHTSRPISFRIRRVGSNASDTNPNPVLMLGLRLVRSS